MKVVSVDGGCFPNPGSMYVAVRIDDEYVIRRVGEGTNNEAEYLAVYYGILEAYTKGYKEILILSDSLLVVNCLTGKWGHDQKFDKYFKMINELIKVTKMKVEYKWVRRNMNPATPLLEEYMRCIFKTYIP